MPDQAIQKVPTIDGHTRLLGIFATPIGHSLSPAMHNLAFAHLHLNYTYLAFEVGREQLPAAIQAMRTLNMRGANISLPNKEAVLPLLDRLTPAARLAGAVNTIINDDGQLTGDTTDGRGVMDDLAAHGHRVKGQTITLIGAGGAATPIAIQTALDGAGLIHIFNRRAGSHWGNAQKLVELINQQTHSKAQLHALEDQAALRKCLAQSTILIDATSMGMGKLKDVSPITDPTMLRSDLVVYDTVYQPRQTKLLRIARQAGVRHAYNGLGMLLYQGAACFKEWTGQEMPVELVKQQVFHGGE